jgi:Flp pilus assembly protein TadD
VQANDPRGLPGVMESRIGQGQWDQALKFADDHIRQSPDRVDYRSALAQMYFRAGKYPEATAQYQELLDKHPKADFAIRLGECKRYDHDYKGAIDAFTRARELEPNNFIPILELGLMYDENMGRHEEARKAYEDVIKLQPDNSTALNNLAYLKADNGVDLDLALSYAQRAQQKEPNNTAITDTVAFIYIQKNLTDDGLRMLRDLVSREPNNPTFHLHLAMALYQKGDRPQAKREIEAAQRNKPSEREQDKIKQLLPKIG